MNECTHARTRARTINSQFHEISDFFFFFLQKLFYRGKSASELHTRYLDTYLSRHGSVLPPHFLKHREDGTIEKVPIPLTDPDSCDPALRGVQVCFFFFLEA